MYIRGVPDQHFQSPAGTGLSGRIVWPDFTGKSGHNRIFLQQIFHNSSKKIQRQRNEKETGIVYLLVLHKGKGLVVKKQVLFVLNCRGRVELYGGGYFVRLS